MKIRGILKKSRGLLVNVLLFVAAFIAISAYQTRDMLSASSDAFAPALSGQLLQGGSYDVASKGERPVLVYFFAPWCSICAASSDNLARLRRIRDDESLHILAVALDWQTREELRHYVERHELEIPVLLGDATIARNWRVFGFPSYYVLDSERRVRWRDFGYSTQLGLWWRTLFVT